MSNFNALKAKVQERFAQLIDPYIDGNGDEKKDSLLVVELDNDELFNAYLAALPEDERQSHTCNCCRTFLKNYGKIVVIREGVVLTLWDFSLDVAPYQNVPAALRDLVLSKPIESSFLSEFDKLGTDSNTQRLENGEVLRWQHLFVKLPRDRVYRSKDVSIASVLGQEQATRQVFERGLKEITVDAIDTVIDLIASGDLYKGDEFLERVEAFNRYKTVYDACKKNAKKLFIWDNFKEGGRIRNSSIGNLLVAISEGEDLEAAVRMFESQVAPANYKRTTSVVTVKMVDAAKKKIASLGYDDALLRRHATLDDIPVGSLIYVNRDKRKLSAFDEVSKGAPVNPKSFFKAPEVKLAEFVDDILPGASRVEVLVPTTDNFVSLIAAVEPESPSMFAWGNSVSWTYQNNLTDVIREKVKAAGGSVDGELRISLEWFNFDDLDLHVIEPDGNKIYFRQPYNSHTGGHLDVDMNAGVGRTREAVENIIFTHKQHMLEGKYQVQVNNFIKRENIDFGFTIQVECQCVVVDLSYKRAVPSGSTIDVASFVYRRATGLGDFRSELDEAYSSREVNGVFTNTFHDVSMVMYSPNHWADTAGHKHLFFILPEAHIDIPLRPFANEFLSRDLYEHRKVFEVLSSKLMVQPAEQQVTGIGYSTTQRNQVVVRINGNKVFKVSI